MEAGVVVEIIIIHMIHIMKSAVFDDVLAVCIASFASHFFLPFHQRKYLLLDTYMNVLLLKREATSASEGLRKRERESKNCRVLSTRATVDMVTVT